METSPLQVQVEGIPTLVQTSPGTSSSQKPVEQPPLLLHLPLQEELPLPGLEDTCSIRL